MVEITGKTRLIAHLGVPTEPFKAPMIYNPWFEHAGVDAAVMPMGVEVGDYPAFLPLLFRLRNMLGALVTMPHKATTASLVDRLSPAAAVAGAGAARRLGPDGLRVGDMCDGGGFGRGMRPKARRSGRASADVIGAG
ncbi:MAG: shikimate dehydrogenase, partial [Alphaproteobacteria bacterium]